MAAAGGGAAAHGARPVYASANSSFAEVQHQILQLWDVQIDTAEDLGIYPSANATPNDIALAYSRAPVLDQESFGTWIVSDCINAPDFADDANLRTLTGKSSITGNDTQLRYRLYFNYNYGGVSLVREDDWDEFGRMPPREALPLREDDPLFEGDRLPDDGTFAQGGMNFLNLLKEQARGLQRDRKAFDDQKAQWEILRQSGLPRNADTVDAAIMSSLSTTEFLPDHAQNVLAQYYAPKYAELPAQMLTMAADHAQSINAAAAETQAVEVDLSETTQMLRGIARANQALRGELGRLQREREELFRRDLAYFAQEQRLRNEVDDLRSELGRQPMLRPDEGDDHVLERDFMRAYIARGGPADAEDPARPAGAANAEGTLEFGANAARSPPHKRSKGRKLP